MSVPLGVWAALTDGAYADVAMLNWTPGTPGYDRYDGTSMATPHVAAVAAMVWAKNPSCTSAQVTAPHDLEGTLACGRTARGVCVQAAGLAL